MYTYKIPYIIEIDFNTGECVTIEIFMCPSIFMERTLSVNYPVLSQNNVVLLNTFAKYHGRKITLYTNTGS